jgi:hypothetical protein
MSQLAAKRYPIEGEKSEEIFMFYWLASCHEMISPREE